MSKKNQYTEHEMKRYEVNRRMIGKEVFIITHGGFYGQCIDTFEDQFLVQVGDYSRWVEIDFVRQPEYFV